MSSLKSNKHPMRDLIYFFNLKKLATKGHRLRVESYGEQFHKSKNGEFDVKDKEYRQKAECLQRHRHGSIIDRRFVPNARKTIYQE